MTFMPHLRGPIRLRGSQLLTLCIALSPLLAQGNAVPGEFRAGFLRQHPDDAPNSGALALQALANERVLGPGLLLVDLTVNLEPVGPRELRFDLDATGTHLQPCLSPGLLAELGLRTEALADPTLLAQQCLNLAEVVPGARVDFDSQRLRLAISIPQIAMRREVAGQVDPARWDAGINAAFVNYQASTLQGSSRGRGRFDSHDLYLTSGINLSGWRLRSSQAWRQDAQGERSWTRAYTYAQTDLPGTWGTLTLGETATDSDLFRGVPVTGLRLATDPEMLPDALRSYAPTIRGVAQTRAKLEIWQNGYPLYSTYVSPGPYAIDDLGVAGSGELEVVLTEADGQVRRYLQPYTALGNLLRPGIARYSFTAGHYNTAGDARSPALWQLTAARGTPWNTTLIGGLMASQGYHAQAVGLARDLGALGALAFDITHASADLGQALGGEIQGMSYALRYSKAFEHGTNLRFAGYRYSTENYRDFDEWVRQTSYDGRFRGSRRSRLEASAYQRLGSNSSLNLNFSQQDLQAATVAHGVGLFLAQVTGFGLYFAGTEIRAVDLLPLHLEIHQPGFFRVEAVGGGADVGHALAIGSTSQVALDRLFAEYRVVLVVDQVEGLQVLLVFVHPGRLGLPRVVLVLLQAPPGRCGFQPPQAIEGLRAEQDILGGRDLDQGGQVLLAVQGIFAYDLVLVAQGMGHLAPKHVVEVFLDPQRFTVDSNRFLGGTPQAVVGIERTANKRTLGVQALDLHRVVRRIVPGDGLARCCLGSGDAPGRGDLALVL
ncbi:fimbrial biogenesis outer membrane usher protein [Pantoea sp. Ap-967]|uniref:fimbria/pilus outer membrane usher protein n=1 Tax=Pantoea sp. Ap-967 TaxID=2608362 RepID=UPI00141E95AE|nr:fimbria/pilus outer membrane usher protein [Pantoea sp. Ap-967]NIE73832.1 fimbrial biogenesis outer membrane usher protein [Pantoea sp. Ap-967]